MSHANAALTPRARLRLARLIVDQGWSPARAAERYDVSWRTATKWAARYRAEGANGMTDRSSRPHRQPRQTPTPMVRKILHLRRKRRWGPVPIAGQLGLSASTVHAVLTREHANRLSHLDRSTGEVIRRYEHSAPGDMLHVDVKKLGNVPDGGGHRYLGRQAGDRNRQATARRTGQRRGDYEPRIGTAFVHTVIDDHSRVAYAEIHDDETAITATGVLRRAVTWYAQRGVTTKRVLSDNGSAYKSHLWRDTCTELGITVKKTRPYRPQTNGKIERFHRTLADGWAFTKLYTSENTRRAALPAFLHDYNHHRPHTAIGKQAPITRLNNLAGHHIYRDPNGQVVRWVQANPGDRRTPVIRDRVAAHPQAHWMSGFHLGSVTSEVSALVGAANAANQVPVLTAYGIPFRDCGGASAGGARDFPEYQQWISRYAQGLGNRLVIVILETDALALQDCLGPDQLRARQQGIATAARTLKAANPNARVYLDGGHSAWHPAAVTAGRLAAAGMPYADGFFTNVANYRPLADEVAYGRAIIAELAARGLPGKRHIVDTSRNGGATGVAGDWCGDDDTDRRIGRNPTLSTGDAGIDGYLWIKRPGEADGCRYAPGTFLPDLAHSQAGGAPRR